MKMRTFERNSMPTMGLAGEAGRLIGASFRGPKGRGTPLSSRRPRPEGAGRREVIFRGLGPRPQGERSEAFTGKGGAQAMLDLGGTARLS